MSDEVQVTILHYPLPRFFDLPWLRLLFKFRFKPVESHVDAVL